MADSDSFDLSGNLDDFLNEDSSAALELDVETGLDSDSVSGIDSVSGFDSVESIESSADLVEEADDLVEHAADDDAAESVVAAPKRKASLLNFSIFDAMLVFSLILVTAAALMMAFGLNDYGSVFGLPWKTTGITVK